VWAREGAADVALLAFFRERGLGESERRDVIDGREVVVMERRL
jgi:hypothetical protein